MNETTVRHKIIWGWLRLFLGCAQVLLAAGSVGALITIGLHPMTWAFGMAATTATIISRLLYHGGPDPDLKRQKTPKSNRFKY